MRHLRIGSARRSKRTHARALAALGAAAFLTLALGAGAASADSRDHRNAENTFTKWITGPGTAPVLANMGGIVGGDVGGGTFSGEVMSKTPTATGAVIDAVYHFHGSTHAFVADVHVVQTGVTAVITGRVMTGWLKGNLVVAGYTQTTCDHDGITTTCFRGWLDILRGTKAAD